MGPRICFSRPTVKRLTEFGTRHTMSGTQAPGRGIVPAREWLAAEFSAIAKGSRLKPFEDRFTAQPDGKRIPSAVEIVNVGVILPGSVQRFFLIFDLISSRAASAEA